MTGKRYAVLIAANPVTMHVAQSRRTRVLLDAGAAPEQPPRVRWGRWSRRRRRGLAMTSAAATRSQAPEAARPTPPHRRCRPGPGCVAADGPERALPRRRRVFLLRVRHGDDGVEVQAQSLVEVGSGTRFPRPRRRRCAGEAAPGPDGRRRCGPVPATSSAPSASAAARSAKTPVVADQRLGDPVDSTGVLCHLPRQIHTGVRHHTGSTRLTTNWPRCLFHFTRQVHDLLVTLTFDKPGIPEQDQALSRSPATCHPRPRETPRLGVLPPAATAS
jgi:hypothetical protein